MKAPCFSSTDVYRKMVGKATYLNCLLNPDRDDSKFLAINILITEWLKDGKKNKDHTNYT